MNVEIHEIVYFVALISLYYVAMILRSRIRRLGITLDILQKRRENINRISYNVVEMS